MYNTLVVYGQEITKEELINFVINGLGLEFEPIITIIVTNLVYQVRKFVQQMLSLQKYEQRLSKILGLSSQQWYDRW